jgi:hypothetical protein
MSEREYPRYVDRLLAQAEELIDSEYEQPEAAALCFEVLALFPEHEEASATVYRAFSDPWLIRDNRKAIGRHIDEWDDRPWQNRRRLALSFRFMSRWEDKYREYEDEDQQWPEEIEAMLEEGRSQLLQDYVAGQGRGSEVAWVIFKEAITRAHAPGQVMLWIGHLYADHGYFAESVEILEDLLAQYPQAEDARRLWAEVRWWRDNQHHIPWIPPVDSKDGSRFRRMVARVHPELITGEPWPGSLVYTPPDEKNLPSDFELPLFLADELVATIEALLDQFSWTPTESSLVDWSYLDVLESGDIDVSRFPQWAQYLLLDIDDPEEEEFLKRFLLSYLANPTIFDETDDDEDWE